MNYLENPTESPHSKRVCKNVVVKFIKNDVKIDATIHESTKNQFRDQDRKYTLKNGRPVDRMVPERCKKARADQDRMGPECPEEVRSSSGDSAS